MDLIVALLAAMLVLVASNFLFRRFYSYRIRDQAVELVLFWRLPVYRIRVNDIDHIAKVSWKELGIGGSMLRLGNRFFGGGVLIEKRRGIFRRVVITPERPDDFVREVEAIRHEGKRHC